MKNATNQLETQSRHQTVNKQKVRGDFNRMGHEGRMSTSARVFSEVGEFGSRRNQLGASKALGAI